MEAAPRLPPGDRDRFSGYGVLGVTFASGHVLALRRMPASSVGPAFASVWHRDPAGRWTFYVDADPASTFVRYFQPAGRAVQEDVIRLDWHGPSLLSVQVPGPAIAWAIHLAASPGAHALAALRRRLPGGVRRQAAVQRAMNGVARRMLRLDSLTTGGRSPSGHRFQLDAHAYWAVDGTTARCKGEHLGPAVSARAAARLGDLTIPAWGVFATGDAYFWADGRATSSRE